MDLRAAANQHVIASVKRLEHALVRIPEHRGDRSRAIGQTHQDVFASLPVDSQLFVSGSERLLKLLALNELQDGCAIHDSLSRLRREGQGTCGNVAAHQPKGWQQRVSIDKTRRANRELMRQSATMAGRRGLFFCGRIFVYTMSVSGAPSLTTMHPSSVNLVRSSHSWTEADSAAGFVLRYLSPMRRQLAKILGSNAEADESLKILLAHLVTAGFGDHKQGKLRDFLIKGVRSCAKARLVDMPEDERPNVDLGAITLESQQWLAYWRDCLMERAWRALERYEHANPGEPVYSILFVMQSQPNINITQLVQQVTRESGKDVDQETVNREIPKARSMFAQLIADEVVETLESPTKDDVKDEIKLLGMSAAFEGLAV